MNTDEGSDLAYLRDLANTFPKVRLVEIPDPIVKPLAFRIHRFFPHAANPDEVYVRLDDDIVYYQQGDIAKVAERRLDLPHPFLVYGNVLNSGLTSHHHQLRDRLTRAHGTCQYLCMDEVGWRNAAFAVDLHKSFLATPSPEAWHLPDHDLLVYERHSINVVSWTGEDAQKWARDVNWDEELWLAVLAPQQFGRPNHCRGDTLFVHFSYHTQREEMDRSGLIESYRQNYANPYHRLEAAAVAIKQAPTSRLKDRDWLARVLASSGLFTWGDPTYGVWSNHVNRNGTPGLWQHPDEFAEFLVNAADLAPRRVLDLGTLYGFGAVFMDAYLSRFVPEVQVIAADDTEWIAQPTPYALRGIDYRPFTVSNDYRGEDYDLVFVDAEHTFAAAQVDYRNLKGARAIAFHDIADEQVKAKDAGGGIMAFWQGVRTTRPSREFRHAGPWMGIGLLT